MVNAIKAKIKKCLFRIIPHRWRRILLRPMIVSQSYKEIISETEMIIDLQRMAVFDNEYWTQLLRKNTHMIDKGLQRDDCEPGHSQAVYKKAVSILHQVNCRNTKADESVMWAIEKLSEYEQFQSSGVILQVEAPVWTEYDNLIRGIKSRRSIRSFVEKAVDMQTLAKIVEPITWSSSSCNRQPAKVFATTDLDMVRQCLANCSGATGFSPYIPAFLCFCADRRAYSMPREIWLPVLDTALGIQNCALTAHSLGLSLTLLSWAAHTPEHDANLRKLLEIPPCYQIVVNAVLGYPKRGVPAPLRKPVEQTLIVRPTSVDPIK